MSGGAHPRSRKRRNPWGFRFGDAPTPQPQAAATSRRSDPRPKTAKARREQSSPPPPRALRTEDAGHPFCFTKSLRRALRDRGPDRGDLLAAMKAWTLEQLDAGNSDVAAGLRASLAAHEPTAVALWTKALRAGGGGGKPPDLAAQRHYERTSAAAAAAANISDHQLRQHVRGEDYCRWTASEAHCRAAAAALGSPVRVAMRSPSAETHAAGRRATSRLALKTYPADGAAPTETSVRDLQDIRHLPNAAAPCVMFVTGGAHYVAVVDARK